MYMPCHATVRMWSLGEQLVGVAYLLPPYGSWGLNSRGWQSQHSKKQPFFLEHYSKGGSPNRRHLLKPPKVILISVTLVSGTRKKGQIHISYYNFRKFLGIASLLKEGVLMLPTMSMSPGDIVQPVKEQIPCVCVHALYNCN